MTGARPAYGNRRADQRPAARVERPACQRVNERTDRYVVRVDADGSIVREVRS